MQLRTGTAGSWRIEGVTQQQVADNVRKAIGDQGYRIQTGDELTKETLERVESQAGEFTTVLLAFAITVQPPRPS